MRLITFLCAFVVMPLVAAPQQGRPGVTDARPRSGWVTGASVIRGRVVAMETGRPLRHAAVTASSDVASRSASTDDDGLFAWSDLPAGKYRLRASVAGYVGLDFGEDANEGGGRDIVLGERETFDRADFRLPRGGVITGRVLDESGEPVEGVQVVAMRLVYGGRSERLTLANGGRTAKRSNDLGRYRIFGLDPGEYYVAATTGSFNAGAPAGGDMASGYGVTFYPGTLDSSKAESIRVSASEETLADVSLVPSRTVEVSGAVVDWTGRPLAFASITMSPGTSGAVGLVARTASAADGSFTFSAVAPGQYTIQALSVPLASPGDVRRTLLSQSSFAVAIVTVEGNTSNVMLQCRMARTMTGRIRFEGGQVPDPESTPIQIVPRAVDYARSPESGTARSRVNADWTFQLTDAWGPQVIDVIAPAGWGLKAVRSGGIDVTDRPIDFEGERGPLEIVMTTQVGGISGTVTDEGRPAANAAVIAFASDRARWAAPSRFVKLATADENGRFTLSPLPAADYRVVALSRVRSGGDWQQPRFLAALARDSTAVAVHEAEHASVDLRVVKPR